jgi:hypothetical protein
MLKEVFSVRNLFDLMQAPPSYKEPDFGTQLTKVEPIWDNDAKVSSILIKLFSALSF